VNELLKVGFCEVDQHTPLAVTVELPSETTLPPDTAPVKSTDVGDEVVTVGKDVLLVVNVT
jgi:hypothetical protein